MFAGPAPTIPWSVVVGDLAGDQGMPQTDAFLMLWQWPFQATKLAMDAMETAMRSQRVVSARLPMIADAMLNPFAADHRELTRMVTEKSGAARTAQRSADAATRKVHAAARANTETWRLMARGAWIGPDAWLRAAELNMAAFSAMATLPADSLKPFHGAVTANDKRLGRRKPG